MSDVASSLAHIQVDEDKLDELSRRFVGRAERKGIIDVAYEIMPSPIGNLVISCSPRGVARIDFAQDREDAVLEEIARRLSPRLLEVPRRTRRVREELEEYFAGKRRRFEVPIDLGAVTGFRRKILLAAARIPFGKTASYRQMAAAAGNDRAVRAAGTALGHNPIPIIVPCHRVLRSDGSLGGYGGGLPRKQTLLELESKVRGKG